MILMRRSNILTGRDPDLAVELATAAADLITGLDDVGRLAASIARQQARAALAINDANAFREHAWYAAELAAVEPVDDDLASYATPAYIASETATGLVVLGQADEAVELLQSHVTAWPDGQRRDHAVAHARLLRALVAVGDYPLAVDRSAETLRAYRAAPSDRARVELRRLARLINDRRRTNRGLHLDAIRVRIAKTLQGDDPNA